jgi:1-acyl-sn-glycerol-3-phosphate acyltransferase
MHFLKSLIKTFIDIALTMTMWIYFTAGFVVFFMPFYIIALFIIPWRERIFQYLNSTFLAGLFFLIRVLVPGLSIAIDEKINSINSSVVICNHRSYLDSILLVSLFRRHTTIVKGTFFAVPIFGWILRFNGYIPSNSGGSVKKYLVDAVRKLDHFLKDGGNLIIFPEGTRNKNGTLSPFKKGAFRIAKICKAPVDVLYVENSDKLYPPGKFFLNTCVKNELRVEWLGRISPEYEKRNVPLKEIKETIRGLYLKRINNPS